jgi:hypothetical protein
MFFKKLQRLQKRCEGSRVFVSCSSKNYRGSKKDAKAPESSSHVLQKIIEAPKEMRRLPSLRLMFFKKLQRLLCLWPDSCLIKEKMQRQPNTMRL